MYRNASDIETPNVIKASTRLVLGFEFYCHVTSHWLKH